MNRRRLLTARIKIALATILALAFAGFLYLALISGTDASATVMVHSSPGAPQLTDTPTDPPTFTPTSTATGSATESPTGTATAACNTYSAALTSGATIVPGTTDTGNHCDNCSTQITLPFSLTLYGQAYTAAWVSSNGYMAFGATNDTFSTACIPADTMTDAILPFWSDQTTAATGKGIYTLVSGTAPNRTFYVEWRNCGADTATTCIGGSDFNYELVFQEGQNSFQVAYGTMGSNPFSAYALGVQQDLTASTQYACDSGGSTGDILTYSYVPSVCPTGTPTLTITPTATATLPPCVPQWRVVATMSPGSLSDVSAPAPDDVWAVGAYGTIHWDGTAWKVKDPLALSKISASDLDNIWAVSNSTVERWNGSGWTNMPEPSPTQTGWTSSYYGIAARSANDVWVVGSRGDSIKSDIPYIILHYINGTWQEIADTELSQQTSSTSAGKPNGAHVPQADILYDVALKGQNDIVAVGAHHDQDFGPVRPIAVGYCDNDPCPAPIAPDNNSAFQGVAVLDTNDVWAVGADAGYQSLIEHWNGTDWKVVSVPNVGPLTGITAPAPNDIWAVSDIYPGGILHWNGTAWTITPSPSAPNAVDSSSPGDVWAVANENILHYPSTQVFTDVPPDNTFYAYINQLSCRTIITGYTSGCAAGNPCFRPGDSVTRGQLAKIASNSAGFSDAQTTRLFEDVPLGSTFQLFIGRLASRGFISGYPCGRPSEPCGSDNLPYFRPNDPVSRGQLAKIVSNTAGLSDPPGAQIFEDVPPGSSFYDFVQRLSIHNIISGYPCGGTSEPCVAPGNRPYFRSNNGATRGQTSKIIVNAFFSGD